MDRGNFHTRADTRWAFLTIWEQCRCPSISQGVKRRQIHGIADTLEDNDRVRITEWRLPPGATTGMHRHQYDYVVVPLRDGRLRLVAPDGTDTFSDLASGEAYFRAAGIEHETFNDAKDEFRFIEIEIK